MDRLPGDFPGVKFERNETALIDIDNSASRYGLTLSDYEGKTEPRQVIRNMVKPEVGLHILECARGNDGIAKQIGMTL